MLRGPLPNKLNGSSLPDDAQGIVCGIPNLYQEHLSDIRQEKQSLHKLTNQTYVDKERYTLLCYQEMRITNMKKFPIYTRTKSIQGFCGDVTQSIIAKEKSYICTTKDTEIHFTMIWDLNANFEECTLFFKCLSVLFGDKLTLVKASLYSSSLIYQIPLDVFQHQRNLCANNIKRVQSIIECVYGQSIIRQYFLCPHCLNINAPEPTKLPIPLLECQSEKLEYMNCKNAKPHELVPAYFIRGPTEVLLIYLSVI